jgi:hypothetical protein
MPSPQVTHQEVLRMEEVIMLRQPQGIQCLIHIRAPLEHVPAHPDLVQTNCRRERRLTTAARRSACRGFVIGQKGRHQTCVVDAIDSA